MNNVSGEEQTIIRRIYKRVEIVSTNNSLFCISLCIVPIVAQHRNIKISIMATKVKWGGEQGERERNYAAQAGEQSLLILYFQPQNLL